MFSISVYLCSIFVHLLNSIHQSDVHKPIEIVTLQSEDLWILLHVGCSSSISIIYKYFESEFVTRIITKILFKDIT